MPANLRLLSVRLPERQIRQCKSRAAAQGLSLQAAVAQALDAWLSRPAPAPPTLSLTEFLDYFQGSLRGADLEAERRADRRLERRHEQRLLRIGARRRP